MMIPDETNTVNPLVTGIPSLPPGLDREIIEHYPSNLPAELTEEEIQQGEDLQWGLFDPKLQELYPDKIVAVYRRQVVAVGADRGTVLEEAERVTGLPGHRIALVTVLGPSILES
jgi:hypothetical protein